MELFLFYFYEIKINIIVFLFSLYQGIENLSLGLNHNFAWSSETGEVYTWGAGLFGKLGFGNTDDINEPTIMDCFNEASKVGMKITHIACGDNHTLAILNTMDEEKKDENKIEE